MVEKLRTVQLYFPHIDNGSATVGYYSIAIVDHTAEVDEEQAEAIKHWTIVDGAGQKTVAPAGPFDEGELGNEPDEGEG